jgi:hypothetical protein
MALAAEVDTSRRYTDGLQMTAARSLIYANKDANASRGNKRFKKEPILRHHCGGRTITDRPKLPSPAASVCGAEGPLFGFCSPSELTLRQREKKASQNVFTSFV